MLKRIDLKCFMKHEYLSIVFTPGLNSCMAKNEAGKSTLLLAIAYALYGSSVLPAPLSEIVTWGRAEKDLRVELGLDDYLFTRGRSGAEVTMDGNVLVTGQTEVSNFAAELLGADAKTAMALMFATQGGLRGVLEDGPKATSDLISTLSDLDLFERILNAAQEKLALGSTAIFEERLKGLRALQDSLPSIAAPLPVEAKVNDRRLKLEHEHGKMPHLINACDHAYGEWKVEYDKREKRTEIEREMERIDVHIADVTARRDALLAEEFPPDLEGDIARLKLLVEEETQQVERLRAYEKLKAYTPVVPVGMDPDTTVRQSLKLRADASTNSAMVSERKGKIETFKAQMITESACGFCGKDLSVVPEVVQRNTALAVEISDQVARIEALIAENREINALVAQYDEVTKHQRTVEKLIRAFGMYLGVDESVTPNTLTWKGSIPSPVFTDNSTTLASATSKLKYRENRDSKVAAFDEVIDAEKVHYAGCLYEIKSLGVASDEVFLALEAQHAKALAELTKVEETVTTLSTEIETTLNEYQIAQDLWIAARERAIEIARDITKAERDVASVGFNNALVKKVRAARPVVANKLWNLVLASVSTLFSQIRGTKSVVTRDGSKFLVNGQCAATLSGSTKDILGLALRVSLVKTFILNCPFLILDEPGQGCDGDRMESLIAFSATCGFKQIVLVTHDPISETFADNLIELG